MKPITIESLRSLAAAISAHPQDTDGYSSAGVTFGAWNPMAVEQLRGLPSATYTESFYPASPNKKPHVIFSARITVDGVEFRAQWSRDATAEEIERCAPRASQRRPETYLPAVSLIEAA